MVGKRDSQMIRAILFDLGNTLLEYESRPGAGAFENALGRLYDFLDARDVTLPSRQRFEADFATAWSVNGEDELPADARLLHALSSLLGGYGIAVPHEELPDVLRAHHEVLSDRAVLYPDTLSTLVELRQSGLRLGVVVNTSWPKEFVLRDLARYELLSLLDVQVFSSDFGRAKPDPAIFRHAVDALGIEPSEAVFVGDDLEEDLLGASRAGLRTVLKFHPRQTRRAFEGDTEVTPGATIEALNQIPAILARWNPAIA